LLPELFKIPGLGINIWTFGVALDVAAIGAVLVIGRLGRRDGLPSRQLYTVLVWAGLASFAGAQVLAIAGSPQPANFRQFWSLGRPHGSGSSFDALLIMLPVSALFARAFALPSWKSLDVFAPGLALASAVARLGCLAAGCCWGVATDSWIGMRFTERAHHLTGVPTDNPLVPTQLISSAACFLIFVLLLVLRRRRAFSGQILLVYLILYSSACLTIGIWRDEPGARSFGLSTTQLTSASTILLAVVLYSTACCRGRYRQTPDCRDRGSALQPVLSASTHLLAPERSHRISFCGPPGRQVARERRHGTQ